MQFQVFLSLWSVTSCLCIDEITKVANTKFSNSKPPHVYWNVEIFAYCHPNVHTKKQGVVSVTAVAMSARRCMFLCESKSTLFGLPKVDTIRNHWLRLVYNTIA